MNAHLSIKNTFESVHPENTLSPLHIVTLVGYLDVTASRSVLYCMIK